MGTINLGKVRGATGERGAEGRSAWIKYNTLPQDAGATDTWTTGQNYIGTQTVVATIKPTTGYIWSLFIPASAVPIDNLESNNPSLSLSANQGRVLNSIKGSQSTTLTVGFTPDCDFNIKNYLGVDYTLSAQLIIVLAISKLPESGGKIILREGIYNILDPIYLNKENITIEGMGSATVLRRMADFQNGIFIVRSNYCEITKCTTDGNKNNYTGATYYGISVNASNIRLSNNNCINAYNGMYLSGSSHLILSGNMLLDNQNIGIVFDNTTKCIVTGNDFKNNAYYGLALYNESNDNTITGGNIFDQNLNNGIYITGSNKNNITGNIFNKNSIYGIYNLNSSNNTITGNSFSANVSGIRVNGSSNIAISANIISDNSNKGIDIYNSSNCGVTGNTLSGNNNYSIDVSGNRNNVSVNTIYQTTGYACINISSGERNMVTSNIVHNRGVVDSGTGTILDNNNPL